MVLSLQCAGQYALVLIEIGDAQAARAVCAEVAESAAAAEAAWGDAAAAAVAAIRLAQARLTAAKDPAAALPELRRAARARAELGTGNACRLRPDQPGGHGMGGRAARSRPASVWTGRGRSPTRNRPGVCQESARRPAGRIGRGSAGVAKARGELTEELTDRELASCAPCADRCPPGRSAASCTCRSTPSRATRRTCTASSGWSPGRTRFGAGRNSASSDRRTARPTPGGFVAVWCATTPLRRSLRPVAQSGAQRSKEITMAGTMVDRPAGRTSTSTTRGFVALMLITAGALVLAGRVLPVAGEALALVLGVELLIWAWARPGRRPVDRRWRAHRGGRGDPGGRRPAGRGRPERHRRCVRGAGRRWLRDGRGGVPAVAGSLDRRGR